MADNRKVTIYDIAEAMHVSSGTVYRALHNTGRISQETRQRVLEMAEKMGYTTNLAAQGLRRNPVYIGCLLCCPVAPFLREIRRGIDAEFEELSQFRVFADIHEIQDNVEGHEAEIDEILREFCDKQYKGVVLFLSGDNRVYSEVVNEMERSGISVATLVADIADSERSIYVSANGTCAGQLAAEILYLTCANKRIAILTGNKNASIHKMNIAGFYEYAKNHPFSEIDVIEHRDISELALEQIAAMFSKGIYDGVYISSASSIYLYQYQKEVGVPPNVRIVITDLFEENRALLEEEVVCATIFQDPYRQGKRVIEMLYQRISIHMEKCQSLLTPQAVFKSNRDLFPLTVKI